MAGRGKLLGVGEIHNQDPTSDTSSEWFDMQAVYTVLSGLTEEALDKSGRRSNSDLGTRSSITASESIGMLQRLQNSLSSTKIKSAISRVLNAKIDARSIARMIAQEDVTN